MPFDDLASALEDTRSPRDVWRAFVQAAEALGFTRVRYSLRAPLRRDALAAVRRDAPDAPWRAAGVRPTPRTRQDPAPSLADEVVFSTVDGAEVVSTSPCTFALAGSGLSSGALQVWVDAADSQLTPRLALLHLYAAQMNARLLAMIEPPGDAGLTGRERECLTLAALGCTNAETAGRLGVSESAVKKHLVSASAKLRARSRTHAVAVALARGLLPL